MIENFPRLLVATEFPPNGSGGGAAIVRQMLQGWPPEKLHWWSLYPDADAHFGQQVQSHDTIQIPRRLIPFVRLHRLKSSVLERFWVPWASRHLRQTILKIRPEAIWAIPSGWAIRPLAAVIPETKTSVHVSIHDYPDDLRAVRVMGEKRCREVARLVDVCYAKATTRDAISQSMVEDLQARTGRDGEVSHAGLRPSDLKFLEHRIEKHSSSIRIAFVGSISAEETFIAFVNAITSIQPQLTRPVTLEIFSAHSYATRPWFDPSWMHERGNLADPEFTVALRECDWGFAPMSLRDDDPRHRFSLSTKFVSYLSAGLPIITMGHPETGVVQIARQYNVGPCITSENPVRLRQIILDAVCLPNPWEIHRSEIIRCAHEEFSSDVLRGRLYRNFEICAQKTSSLQNGMKLA